MLSSTQFIRQSLELHLFFDRIMKEHSFFLQIGFTSKNTKLIQQADRFRIEFDRVLADAVSLSIGVVGRGVLESGEVITPYTLKAERATSYYTGVVIPKALTEAEAELTSNGMMKFGTMLEQRVSVLNQRTLTLVDGLAGFKTKVLSDMLSCRIFTGNYPLLIDHILREAKLYHMMLRRLQSNEEVELEKEAYEQETFWNRIMAEHSKFIKGFLDPTENELINTANNFGNEFDQLTREAIEAMNRSMPIDQITEDSLVETKKIRDFKEQATQGLVNCKIKSIIIPLLGDHTLREASHYLRLLKQFSNGIG